MGRQESLLVEQDAQQPNEFVHRDDRQKRTPGGAGATDLPIQDLVPSVCSSRLENRFRSRRIRSVSCVGSATAGSAGINPTRVCTLIGTVIPEGSVSRS